MPSPEDLLVAVVFLLVLTALGGLVRSLVGSYLMPWASRRDMAFTVMIFGAVRPWLPLWFALAGIAGSLRLVELDAAIRETVDKGLAAILILSLTLLALAVLGKSIRLYGERVETVKPIGGMLERIGQMVIIAVGTLTLLGYLGVEIAALLTGLGVAGLATALALQDTLANFFAGMHLLADRPIRVGDYVKLDGGEEGYVVDVGWRSTRIRMLSNNVVIVPNQKLAQSIVTNYYFPEKRMSLLVPVSVSYESDPEHVERVLVAVASEAAGEVDGLLAEPAPFVRFIPGFGAYSLDFTLICQVREFVDQYAVQHELRKRIWARFRQEGIQIPFPVHTVHLSDGRVGGGDAASQVAESGRLRPGG